MSPVSTISATNPLPLKQSDTNPIAKVGSGFADIIKSTISEVAKAEHQADKSIEDLQTGKSKNLHEVMISVEKADISLKMLVQFRNKTLQAYEEIMRMQI
ncbi:MAG TPA: flagellar hook-basal body complex protein FliE [Desulfobacterales bacterium]|nr:flagellar hook-basal body complex protein FliE [Desulfobacterales bacterium]HIP39838.1 flagellar hook-basal body complex protein FliE [Desulfocapsa sulfexigens]